MFCCNVARAFKTAGEHRGGGAQVEFAGPFLRLPLLLRFSSVVFCLLPSFGLPLLRPSRNIVEVASGSFAQVPREVILIAEIRATPAARDLTRPARPVRAGSNLTAAAIISKGRRIVSRKTLRANVCRCPARIAPTRFGGSWCTSSSRIAPSVRSSSKDTCITRISPTIMVWTLLANLI